MNALQDLLDFLVLHGAAVRFGALVIVFVWYTVKSSAVKFSAAKRAGTPVQKKQQTKIMLPISKQRPRCHVAILQQNRTPPTSPKSKKGLIQRVKCAEREAFENSSEASTVDSDSGNQYIGKWAYGTCLWDTLRCEEPGLPAQDVHDRNEKKSSRKYASDPLGQCKKVRRLDEDGAENATNANAQKFLLEVGSSARWSSIDIAKQVYKMLTSSNIPVSAKTYQLLVDIATWGNDLDLATEMSIEMEKQTGTKVSEDTTDRMIELYLVDQKDRNGSQVTNLDSVGTALRYNELVTELTSHPWFGISSQQQRKYQIFASSTGQLLCLHMSGEASPEFCLDELFWDGLDVTLIGSIPGDREDGATGTLCWGNEYHYKITLGSTVEEIKRGSVVWNGDGGHSWQWFPEKLSWLHGSLSPSHYQQMS